MGPMLIAVDALRKPGNATAVQMDYIAHLKGY